MFVLCLLSCLCFLESTLLYNSWLIHTVSFPAIDVSRFIIAFEHRVSDCSDKSA